MKIAGLLSAYERLEIIHSECILFFSAYESGLLNCANIPCNKETLINKLNVKRPETLDALLQVGLALKELKLENDLFSIKGKRSKAIVGINGDMLAAMVQANVTYYSDAYRNIDSRIRGGELGEDLYKIGDVVARFSKITEPIIREFISNIIRSRNHIRMLDVGCGSGILLKSAFDSNPNTTGVGLDIDVAVVQQAKQNISKWKLSDRLILNGDIRYSK